MAKICQITGKKAANGKNVSHSKVHTARQFQVNLFQKKFYWPEQDCFVQLKVSGHGLKVINRIGVDAAIRQAVQKGII